MTDVTDRLAHLGPSAPEASDVTVRGDLARARAALSQRRRRRAAVAGTGLTLTVGAVFGVVVVSQAGDGPVASPPAASDAPDPRPDDAREGGVELVAYAGEQPAGFVLDKVPEGYVVQGADAFALVLAEPGVETHLHDYRQKLVVMLESQSAPAGEMSGDPVTVNGHPGALRASEGARILEFHDGEREVLVQAWDSIGLTDDQLVEFAASITVTATAQPGVG